jgi:hypothetical protein
MLVIRTPDRLKLEKEANSSIQQQVPARFLLGFSPSQKSPQSNASGLYQAWHLLCVAPGVAVIKDLATKSLLSELIDFDLQAPILVAPKTSLPRMWRPDLQLVGAWHVFHL